MSDITYIKTTGVLRKFKKQLKILAKNKDITLSNLGRIALRKYYESEPENLKRDLD